jgi:methyl-accepting chemotaxis protein
LMAANARSMSSSADRTGTSAQSAATAAAQALATAQTVASAAEELSASIREIGGQVDQSTEVVARAVEAGRSTRQTMEALNQQVGRIGVVADMISEIAGKTNLLALNATIEAARAGDAGKGFAVVASEVKQLANQTAHSTAEIGRQIAEVRSATRASVAAVSHIEQTIDEVNAIAGSIAAAVEEQGAATAEIARNVTETTAASHAMAERAHEVSMEAERTGKQAVEVLENITAVDTAMQQLQRSVIRVVRTSMGDVERRRYRRRPCVADATASCNGQSAVATVHDISERGCYAVVALPSQIGQQLTLELPRLSSRLQGVVVAQTQDGLHLAFTGKGLSAADADRLSLTTVRELVQMAKQNQAAFLQHALGATAGSGAARGDRSTLADADWFGAWYEGVNDPLTLALPSFNAIAEPCRAAHECRHRAIAAMAEGDMPAVQHCAAELRQHGEVIARWLDQFDREFPATFLQSGANVPTAAAA